MTIPARAFVPPAPFPPQFRDPSYAWYGTRELWTELHQDGEVWWALPASENGFTQKTSWRSVNYQGIEREPRPAIRLTGRRLDGPGLSFEGGNPGGSGYRTGHFMLVGIVVPTAGCWEIEAEYRGHSLAYTVWVAGARD